MGCQLIDRLTCPIDHSSRRRLECCHDIHLGHTSVVILLEIGQVLVTYKLKGHGMVRNRNRELSAEGRFARVLGKGCRNCSDEEAVRIEAEHGHLLHTGTIRIHGFCLHLVHIRNLGIELYSPVAFGGISRSGQQVLSLA